MSLGNINLGIDLGGTRTKLGLVNQEGKILCQKVFLTQARLGPDAWLDNLSTAFKEWMADYPVTAAGLGVPVLINRREGTLRDCRQQPNLPGWDGLAICKEVEKRLRVPVYMEIDSNVMAIAERTVGQCKTIDDFIVVTLGTGVGSGVFSGGKIITGHHRITPVLGHLTICHDGPVCSCGSRGCLELYIGLSAVLNRAGKLAGRTISSLEEISEAQEQNQPWVEELLEKIGYFLGVGLANMVHAFNPERIILGGGLTHLGPKLRETAWKAMEPRLFKSFAEGLHMEISALGDMIGVFGAAMLAEQQSRSGRTDLAKGY